ncbi:MAG: response regulator [Bacteroidia bacterium]
MVLQSGRIPVIFISASLEPAWLNPFALEMLGKPADFPIQNMAFRDLATMLMPGKPEKCMGLFAGKQEFSFETTFDNHTFAFTAIPVNDEKGEFSGFSLIGKDITEIIERDEQILESNLELNDLFMQNVTPMCFTDLNGNFIMANKAYGELFALDCESLAGRNFMEVHCSAMTEIEQEALREEAIRTLSSANSRHVHEIMLYRSNGEPMRLEVTRKLVKIRKRLVVSVYVNDISEKYESRQQITEQNNRLREFAFLTSHKLRQPLSNILGLIDLVKTESGASRDVTITMETMRLLTGQLDKVVTEMGEVLAELDVEIERGFLPEGAEQGRVETVWLVDDDQVITYITERLIKNADPSVVVTSFLSSKMALEKLRIAASVPDLLLLDINMPGLNGWEFLEQLRAMQKYVNVYMYSSSIDPEDVKKAHSYPMVRDFLSKPIDISAMRKILEIPVVRAHVS